MGLIKGIIKAIYGKFGVKGVIITGFLFAMLCLFLVWKAIKIGALILVYVAVIMFIAGVIYAIFGGKKKTEE